MPQVIPNRSYETKRWKNGAGITHEILAVPGPDTYAWRLSLAEVGRDGPFSQFDGMSRILTVIEGGGMSLVGPHETLQADLFSPVTFSGALPITGVLNDEPIRNINLIFDSSRVSGAVQVLRYAMAKLQAGPDQTQVLYVACGSALVADVQISGGDCALWRDEEALVKVADDAVALLITVTGSDGT